MTTLDDIKKRFAADYFATEAALCVIDEARRDYARCSFSIEKKHLNAAGGVMGGALFTLADFCFAVAANTENPLTVSVAANINFLASVRGKKLTAEAECVKSGKSTCFFTVHIRDDENTPVAEAAFTGFRKRQGD